MEIENRFQILDGRDGPDAGQLLAALTAAGYSNTRARRAVLEALCEAGGQATPARLLALGRSFHAKLGLVTVYRTLDILLALGLVRRLHLEEGCHSYAPTTHDHGHHVICQRCQRTVEFEGCDLEAVVKAVEAQTGFLVNDHWLEMFGLCAGCRAGAVDQTSADDAAAAPHTQDVAAGLRD